MQVIIAPDPRLKIQTKAVKKITPALLQTLKEMVNLTKTFTEPEGVGLASTQIGLDEAFFVARLDESARLDERLAKRTKDVTSDKQVDQHFLIVINPKIISTGKSIKKYFEGCLSVPNMWGEVRRYTTIKVSFQDTSGKVINQTLTSVLAWIFQHEIDHLNGVLFSERVLQQKGKFYKFLGKDKTGTDMFEEVTI